MRVTVLGAGTAIPAQGYSPAGIYVRVAGEHVLLDAGAGSLQRLQAIGAPWAELDRIFLTHFHIDHCLDLVSILFALRVPGPGLTRKKPLAIYGPPGLKQLYRRLNTAHDGWLTPKSFRLTIRELGKSTLRLKGYAVATQRMDHYATRAIGYRLTARGKSLAYSGDTDRCDGVMELGRGADLLILECSMTDERKVIGHLTPTDCGRIAAETGCRHLVLTHFYPVFHRYDIRRRVRRSFRGRLTLARDLTAFSL